MNLNYGCIKNYPDKFIDIDITLLYKLFKKLKQ